MLKALSVFERSSCACSQCRQTCRSGKPGCLAPSDVDHIAEYIGLDEASDEFIRKSFQACVDGPRTAVADFPDGETPAIRPRVRKDGSCIFLGPDDECLIHPVAPFECGRVDACDPASGAAAMKRLGSEIAGSRDYVMLWKWLLDQQNGITA
ncbi:hypothetical protein [Planctomicrobium piriforme]|uniref:Zinc-or iron-chelating domain-containing protein n=1 Tax=Planctomicrobium piriforme TaxID=1576369 RepID=A0A1I3EFK6_9PLAN|nr:hypothetical protein [Planctomicrobium piriforme]SFH97706.1 hypothetical protein SAMN05421753_104200 [Planctomicrobium piriforme]